MSEASASSQITQPACPICGKPQEEKFRPFCSKRCADIDLSRWLKGVYAIPAEEVGEPGSEGPSSEEDR